MKKILSLFISAAFVLSVSSQVNFQIVPGQSKINYLKSGLGVDPDIQQEIEVRVTFSGKTPMADVPLAFVIRNSSPGCIPFNPAIVNPVGGYFIPKDKVEVNPKSLIIKVKIKINVSSTITANENFDLKLIDNIEPNDPTHRVVIEPISTEEASIEAKKKKTTFDNILLLNAYNFDFGSNGLSSKYVGHLNFNFPSSSKNNKWGFNAGIMKINYGQKDTSGGILLRENVFISPFDTVANGLKYLKQINAYKTEKRNTVWSFYVQGLYELTNKADNFHVYAHAHLELLASKWSSTTTITNLKQDTGIISPSSIPSMIRSNLQNSSSYSINSLSGYLGFGVTFDVKPWKGGSFFFQPTMGITSNKPSVSSIDINSIPVSNSNAKSDKPRIWNGFYLVRAYFKQEISEEKATAIIGVDIRGLLPFYAPQYAAYVGLNLTLKSIGDLFKK